MRKITAFLALWCAIGVGPIACAKSKPLQCGAPTGILTYQSTTDLPPAVASLLHKAVPDLSPVDGPFDATDVVMHEPPRFHRLLFIWSQKNLWLIATERGGLGYNNPLYAYRLSSDGTASLTTQQVAFPPHVCSIAAAMMQTTNLSPQ